MRIQSLALATTLALFSSSAITASSFAQKGSVLQPESAWAVKRLNDNTPEAYCALARRFNNGVILTLAQNERYEASFALDFPQDSFDAAERYAITLDPGAGEQRQFKVKPAASGKAFVIRFGHDQKFMTSLANTGYLRVVIGDASYNFNLADIDIGQQQMDTCLQKENVQISAGTGSSGAGKSGGAPASGELASLRAAKDDLQQRLEALEKENEALRLSAAEGKTPSQKDGKGVATPALSVETSPAVGGFLRQIESLKAENEALKKLADAGSGKDGAAKQDISIVELARENQRLQEMLEAGAKGADYEAEVKSLTQRISTLEQENLELARAPKAQAVDPDFKKDMERQILALKSENDALRDSLELQSSNTNSDQDFAKLRDQIAALEKENTGLNTRVAGLMEEKDAISISLKDPAGKTDVSNGVADKEPANAAALAQLQEEIKRSERANAKALAEKESEIATLQADLVAAKKFQEDAKTTRDSLKQETQAEFQAQIDALRIKNDALKAELVSLSQNQAALAEFKGKVDLLTGEKTALQKRLDETQDQVAALQEKLQAQDVMQSAAVDQSDKAAQEISGLKAEISSLQRSLETLGAENTALKDGEKRHADSADALEKTLGGMKDELAAAQKENEALKSAMAGMEQDKGGQGEKISSLLEENETLRRDLERGQSEHSGRVAALEETLRQLEDNNHALQQENSSRVATLEQEIVTLQGALDAVQKAEEVAALSITEDPFAKQGGAEMEQMRQDLDGLRKENGDLRLALSTAEEFNEEIRQQWASAIESYQALKGEQDAVLAQASDANPAQDSGGDQLAALEEKNVRLQEQLESQSREYLALIRDFENMKQQEAGGGVRQAALDTGEMDALRDANQSLRGEVDSLRRQLSAGELPEVRQASAVTGGKPVSGAAARAAKVAAADEREAELAASLAAIETAAGEDEAEQTPAQTSPEPVADASTMRAEDTAVSMVQDYGAEVMMEAEESGLNEAQKLEQSLKRQIEDAASIMPVVAPSVAAAKPDMDAAGEEMMRAALPEEMLDDSALVGAGAIQQEPLPEGRPDMMQSAIMADPRADTGATQGAAGGVYRPNVDVADVLGAADIALVEPVSIVSGFSGADRVAYQWRSGHDLYGSAHQKPMTDMDDFDAYVREYLTMTEDRCTGDFAIVPSATEQIGQTRIDSYEIACVGAGVDSSASVVFFNRDGTFTVLAHEGSTQAMGTAMEVRDKIVSFVEKS